LIDRALILNALVNIYFKAPIYIIKEWIERHNLTLSLSSSEKELLDKENDELTEQEKDKHLLAYRIFMGVYVGWRSDR
jgi:hypothetical protein